MYTNLTFLSLKVKVDTVQVRRAEIPFPRTIDNWWWCQSLEILFMTAMLDMVALFLQLIGEGRH